MRLLFVTQCEQRDRRVRTARQGAPDGGYIRKNRAIRWSRAKCLRFHALTQSGATGAQGAAVRSWDLVSHGRTLLEGPTAASDRARSLTEPLVSSAVPPWSRQACHILAPLE